MTSSPTVVLTIGGSDSGGAHGVQADLRTFAALGVLGTCAITVVTAQDSTAIHSASPVPTDVVLAQIDAVIGDLPVTAVKTGMLGRVELVEAIAALAAAGRLPNLVVDPVLVDRHGRSPFPTEVVDAYREQLLPHATVITPNRDELALLDGKAISGIEDLEAAASRLRARAVFASGGRLLGDEVVDVFVRDGAARRIRGVRTITTNTAGTGDTLSAAIAAGLAQGLDLDDAVDDAVGVIRSAVARAATWHLGKGPGPVDPPHRV